MTFRPTTNVKRPIHAVARTSRQADKTLSRRRMIPLSGDLRWISEALVQRSGLAHQLSNDLRRDLIAFAQLDRRHLVLSSRFQSRLDSLQSLPPPETKQNSHLF